MAATRPKKLNPAQNLKSAEEMEEEEKEAQSAKLQELIRRGSPDDLREANRLMKVMAGYDTRSRTDYRAKAAEEVSKIQAKARLLEERLEAFKVGDTMTDGDVFGELASALQNAQPKIQKMCEEESDDHEAVARLFEINDSIHRTVERYRLMKKGDMEAAAKIASGAPVPSAAAPASSSSGNAANELSLIDFDADAAAHDANGVNATAGSNSQTGGIEDDLLGLDLGDTSGNFGQGGNIALGFGANQSKPAAQLCLFSSSSIRASMLVHLLISTRVDIPGPALLSTMTQDNSAKGNVTPSFSNFTSFASPATSQSGTPQPAAQQQPRPPPTRESTNDPFAAFAASSTSTPPPSHSQPVVAPNDDDEWSFSSALPPAASSKPREHKGTISLSTLRTDFLAGRTPGAGNSIHMAFAFSNNSAQPMTELHFQLAVTKVCFALSSMLAIRTPGLICCTKGYELQLKPQTGRDLAPKQSRGVTQEVDVWHAGNRAQKVESVKLRWRATYKVGGEQKNETGEIPEFSIA